MAIIEGRKPGIVLADARPAMTTKSLAKANDWRKSGDELFAELASKWVTFLLAIKNREAAHLELWPGLFVSS